MVTSRYFLMGLCFGLAGFVSSVIAADDVAVADDGREVRLLEDGTWEYVSEDKFATTISGKRVRLKADGSWQLVDSDDAAAYAPVPAAGRAVDSAQIDDAGVDLILDEVIIEAAREDAHKNTRVRSQMLFFVKVSSDTELLLPAPESVEISDSKGRVYPTADVRRVADDKIVVIADGAPRWWGVKFFTLDFAPGSIGNGKSFNLRKSKADVISKNVEALSVY